MVSARTCTLALALNLLPGFVMIDTRRQVPSPSASAWLIDLTAAGGPRFVVVRREEDEARDALVAHLVEIGSIPNTIAAERLVGRAPIESVAVTW